MSTSNILLAALLLLAFEGFMLKGMVIMADAYAIISNFGLADFPRLTLASGNDLIAGIANIGNGIIYIIELVWWVLRAAGAFIAIFFTLIATAFTLSSAFPILWICNMPIIVLLIYAIVSAIKVLGSSMGGGDKD